MANRIAIPAQRYSILLTLFSFIAYGGIYYIVPDIRPLFTKYGLDLPTLTAFSLQWYGYSVIVSLLGIIPCLLILLNETADEVISSRWLNLVIIHFIIAFVLFAVVTWSMYLPLVELREL